MESPSTRPDYVLPGHLLCIDVLRGFTMFWLIGGKELILAIVLCFFPAYFDVVETQLTHPKWTGYVAWDFIMPFFLFLAGCSMPFAFRKRSSYHTGKIYLRIIRRVVILWLLGIFIQSSPLKTDTQGLELYSNALQAIAVGYLVTSLALLYLHLPGQIVLFAALLLAYWGLLVCIPFNGHPAGTLEKYANFARYVDELVLRGFRRNHSFTWVITSLGFAATVLLGSMAGQILKSALSHRKKLVSLLTIGFVCLIVGWLWSYWLPLNRHLWTSSMVVWAGGISFLLLATAYGLFDVADIHRGTKPFVILSANALFAFVFACYFGRTFSNSVLIGLANQLPQNYAELLLASGEVVLLWLILWYLYHKRIFLRA